MKFKKLITEITQDAQWNLNYIFNDLQARIKKKSGPPNFGLSGIVDSVRQEFFLYHKKGKKRYGITVWFYPDIDEEKIKEVAAFIKDIHGEMFRKFNFSIEINNKLLKIILDEDSSK